MKQPLTFTNIDEVLNYVGTVLAKNWLQRFWYNLRAAFIFTKHKEDIIATIFILHARLELLQRELDGKDV